MKRRKKARSRAPAKSHGRAFIATIVLIVALPEERNYFHATLASRPGWSADWELPRYRCRLETGDGPVEIIVHTLSGMGLIEAVVGTSGAIASFSPDLVFVIGISGSLDHQLVGLGDVVISNRAKLYAGNKIAAVNPHPIGGYQYRFDNMVVGPRPTNEVWIDHRDKFMENSYIRYERKYVELPSIDDLFSRVQPTLSARPLKQINLDSIPSSFRTLPSIARQRQLHYGWILGSHHVVDSAEYRSYLVEKNTELHRDVHLQTNDFSRSHWTEGNLLAVDMESYGVLRAVQDATGKPSWAGGSENLLGGIAIRGISDMCQEKKATDIGANEAKSGNNASKNEIRRLAVENLTEICLTFIESLDYQEIVRQR